MICKYILSIILLQFNDLHFFILCKMLKLSMQYEAIDTHSINITDKELLYINSKHDEIV